MESKKLTAVVFAWVFICSALLVPGPFSYAEIPSTINYQGYLTDEAGRPVTDRASITLSLGGEDSFGDGYSTALYCIRNGDPWP